VSEITDTSSIDLIFVVGEVRSRADLLATLPERISRLAEPLHIGARHSGHDDDELQRAIEAACVRRH
jgi:peptide chain release factor subunit 1